MADRNTQTAVVSYVHGEAIKPSIAFASLGKKKKEEEETAMALSAITLKPSLCSSVYILE